MTQNIDYSNINSNDSGASVRAKLNKMFSDLINGGKSVNQVWVELIDIVETQKALGETTTEKYDELKERILKSYDYTDVKAYDLINYVNSIEGGIAGVADTTEYDPNIPESRTGVVVALGSGVFTHLLGPDGQPITVTNPQAFTVFYKASDSTYWSSKTLNLDVTVDTNIDGGTAFTKFGGSKVVDGGGAQGRGTVIQYARDTKANWSTLNPVIPEGEPIIEKDTGVVKIGDGVTRYNSLEKSSPHITDKLGSSKVATPDQKTISDEFGKYQSVINQFK